MNFIALHKSSNQVQTNDARAFLSFFGTIFVSLTTVKNRLFKIIFNSISIAKTKMFCLKSVLVLYSNKCHFIYNTMSFTLF